MKIFSVSKYFPTAFSILLPAGLVGFFWHVSFEDFWGNYFFLAAASLIWILLCYVINLRFVSYYAGLVATNGTLTFLFAGFEICRCNDNAMGWLFLWPLTVIVLIVSIIVSRVFLKKSQRTVR